MNAISPYALVLGVLGAGAAAFALKGSSHDMANVKSTVDGDYYYSPDGIHYTFFP